MGRVLLQNTGYWAWDGIEEQKNLETARAIVFCCGSFRRGMMGTPRNLTIARIRWAFLWDRSNLSHNVSEIKYSDIFTVASALDFYFITLLQTLFKSDLLAPSEENLWRSYDNALRSEKHALFYLECHYKILTGQVPYISRAFKMHYVHSYHIIINCYSS